jgi:hypothetical protein
MNMEQLVERESVEETEVLGENVAQCHFVHQKFHLNAMGSNPGRRSGKPATSRPSYGTVKE